jgi:hypothetical protein
MVDAHAAVPESMFLIERTIRRPGAGDGPAVPGQNSRITPARPYAESIWFTPTALLEPRGPAPSSVDDGTGARLVAVLVPPVPVPVPLRWTVGAAQLSWIRGSAAQDSMLM